MRREMLDTVTKWKSRFIGMRSKGKPCASEALFRFLLFAFAFLLFNACKKEKIDFTYDNSPVEREPSAVRIVNLGHYYSQLVANGDSLTNFNSPGSGLPYFPTTSGLLGTDWWIPKELFADQGRLDLSLSGNLANGEILNFGINEVNSNNPTDYYVLRPEGSGQPWVVPVQRDDTPPARADHFKIRILNLTKTLPALQFPAYIGPKENLEGAITLAYADGTPVSDATTNISLVGRVSEYVELPYGTYQFKLLTADGRQISATNALPDQSYVPISPANSTVAHVNGGNATTRVTFAPVETYQPGGVYTIVVAPFIFSYWSPNSLALMTTLQNGFKCIDDNTVQLNDVYTRVQAVNALPDNNVTFRVNGTNLAVGVAFGQNSEYGILASGNCLIEAVNGAGNVLASTEYFLEPRRNYSIWSYPDVNGSPQLLVAFNDLSGQLFSPLFDDDGSYNHLSYDMAFGTRFLNLSPDIPYLSFTIGDGQNATAGTAVSEEVMYNLRPGVFPEGRPYVWWSYTGDVLFKLMAYRSTPGVTPGTWAHDIPVRSSSDFVARPQLYQQVNRVVPPSEPGIYTVAVIGRTGDAVPEEQKARMIIVKHNK